ncbi:hypothetical protein PG630_03315 [Riemerella anatipestifer]|nr:hypothetical protein [Riemerella anatipestifer]
MGTALTVFFVNDTKVQISVELLSLVFLTYFNGYLYTKYQYRKPIIGRILVVNAVSFALGVILILSFYSVDVLLKWLTILLLGLAYNSRFLNTFVRKIPLLKIFYVGLSWALVSAWLFLPKIDGAIFLVSFLYVSALVLPFDIRDKSSDKVLTFPKFIGVAATKRLAYVLLIFSGGLSFIYFNTLYAVAFGGAIVVALALVYGASESKPDWYFSLLVETCCGLPLLFLILLEYFWLIFQ